MGLLVDFEQINCNKSGNLEYGLLLAYIKELI